MKLLWTSLLAVSLLIAAAPEGLAAKPTILRLHYSGATPFGAAALEDECDGSVPVAIGVVCLVVPKGIVDASFLINDASSLTVGGTYYVYDAAGVATAAGAHCGSGSSPVVAGGTVVVRLELINGPLYCLSKGVTGGEATRGFVEFSLK